MSADALQTGEGAGQGSSTIHWPGEDGQRYHLLIARDETFERPLLDTWLTEPRWSTEELPAGAYFMRLQVEDSHGVRGNFSAPRQFRTGNWVTDASGQMLQTGDGERLMRQ